MRSWAFQVGRFQGKFDVFHVACWISTGNPNQCHCQANPKSRNHQPHKLASHLRYCQDLFRDFMENFQNLISWLERFSTLFEIFFLVVYQRQFHLLFYLQKCRVSCEPSQLRRRQTIRLSWLDSILQVSLQSNEADRSTPETIYHRHSYFDASKCSSGYFRRNIHVLNIMNMYFTVDHCMWVLKGLYSVACISEAKWKSIPGVYLGFMNLNSHSLCIWWPLPLKQMSFVRLDIRKDIFIESTSKSTSKIIQPQDSITFYKLVWKYYNHWKVSFHKILTPALIHFQGSRHESHRGTLIQVIASSCDMHIAT